MKVTLLKRDEIKDTIYDKAVKVLMKKLEVTGFSPEFAETIISEHINEFESGPMEASLNEYYERLLVSAQNTQWKPRSIGGSIGGLENLEDTLFGFDPRRVVAEYGDDWKELWDTIDCKLKPRVKKPRENVEKSDWGKFCKTILSSACYFSEFENGSAFFNHAKDYHDDETKVDELPNEISKRIFGVGYTLACDFLKERGFVNYGKPDVIIKSIFQDLELLGEKATELNFQEEIRDIAKRAEKSPYQVDKALWLIGSGRFYKRDLMFIEPRKMRDEFVRSFSSDQSSQNQQT